MMGGQKSGASVDERLQKQADGASADATPEPELNCGCGVGGPGGRLRIALLLIGAVIIFGLIAYGFMSAG